MDSLLIALLDKSGSMTDGDNTPEYLAWVEEYRRHQDDKDWHKAKDWLKANPMMPMAEYSLKAKATMDAFNHFLQVMKYRRDACDFYMAQFAGRRRDLSAPSRRGPLEYELTHNFVDLFEAEPLNSQTYRPDGGGTAIYDAILQAIANAEAKIANLPVDERPTQVTMLIQTDGDDNSSQSSAKMAWEKMNDLRRQRWNFVFLGTGVIGQRTGERLDFVLGKDLLEYEDAAAEGSFAKAAEAVLESLITGTLDLKEV